LREMDAAGMMLDLTHLNDQSFYEALERYPGSVLASHSNCRALAPGERQLSDDQIRTLLAHDGMMGIVSAVWMLKEPSGDPTQLRDQVSMETVADHIDHVCQLAGNAEHVGIGSDLDGGFGNRGCPRDLDTFADQLKLVDILRGRGYAEAQIRDVMYGNWVRHFTRAWTR
ncbi:MAG: peptidase M19, partial [Chloroflexi bacterium]|nr:peptidase M19 [Chloroflexota bacterium]